MASVVLGRRSATVARQTTDRELLHAFLAQDRLYAAYAICDLEAREFGRTRWGAAYDGDDLVAVGLEYTGPTATDLRDGRQDGSAPSSDAIRPRAAHRDPGEHAPRWRRTPVDFGPQTIRMGGPRDSPYPATVQRLRARTSASSTAYQLGFASWLPSSDGDGVYYGCACMAVSWRPPARTS
jgi:hypothetical protein